MKAANSAEPRAMTAGSGSAKKPMFSSGIQGIQNLVFPGLVALGCWGMAFSFFFFYADPNHVLYGGMASLMALLWTFSFALRLRKVTRARQRARA